MSVYFLEKYLSYVELQLSNFICKKFLLTFFFILWMFDRNTQQTELHILSWYRILIKFTGILLVFIFLCIEQSFWELYSVEFPYAIITRLVFLFTDFIIIIQKKNSEYLWKRKLYIFYVNKYLKKRPSFLLVLQAVCKLSGLTQHILCRNLVGNSLFPAVESVWQKW